jgi:hypothetical protein
MGLLARMARQNLRNSMKIIQEEFGTSQLVTDFEIQKLNGTMVANFKRLEERVTGFFQFWEPEFPSLPPSKAVRDFENFLFSSDYSIATAMFLIEFSMMTLESNDIKKLLQIMTYFHEEKYAQQKENGYRLNLYFYKIYLIAKCWEYTQCDRTPIMLYINTLQLESSPELQIETLSYGLLNFDSNWKTDVVKTFHKL